MKWFGSVLPIVAAALSAVTLPPVAGVAAPRPGYWERIAQPQREQVDTLIARAQAELDEQSLTGVSLEGATRADALLGEALKLEPANFLGTVLLGEALVIERRGGEAIGQFERACTLSQSSEEESWCTLRLAIEKSKAGRYAEALADYDRHIRLGEARGATYANSAEILMALGRLPESQVRYREAVRLDEEDPAGRERDENLALALYGLAVALDRDEQAAASHETITRAVVLDPKLALLDAARDGRSTVFFVPPGDVHYYRGLALQVLGRNQEAVAAFQRFLTEPHGAGELRFAKRAEAHLSELTVPDEPRPGRPYKVAAVATVQADGPLPAPLIDAAWRSRGGLVDSCLDEPPAAVRGTLRISLQVELDGKGGVRTVTAEDVPDEWKALGPCLESRVKAGLRVSRPSRARPTSARIQLVLAVRS